jgi:protein TonB
MDVQGKVIITFIIERDGRVTNAKVIRSLSPSFDAEALRVINSSPKWKPGTIGGKTVRMQFTVPVPFRMYN